MPPRVREVWALAMTMTMTMTIGRTRVYLTSWRSTMAGPGRLGVQSEEAHTRSGAGVEL